MAHPVVHFEVWGQDGEELQEFYTKAFSWKLNIVDSMGYGLTQIQAGKGIEGAVFGTQPDQPPTGVTFYIETDKIDPHLKKIEKAGGKTIVKRTVLPGMVTFAQFADPAGNVVGLVESERPPAPDGAQAAAASAAPKGRKKAAKAAAPKKAAKAAAPKKAAKAAAPKEAAAPKKAAAKKASKKKGR